MVWLSSYFDSFPNEVVTIIFELGTFSEVGKLQHNHNDSPFVFESSCHSTNYTYAPNFPILVSHVSRRWREIALNTPTLWSTLFFENSSHIDRGRAFLERCSPRGSSSPELCSGYLLDIIIATVPFNRKTVQSDESSISKRELEKIFDLLVPVTVRWRSFYLRVRDNHCKKVARLALGGTCGRAPNLEVLQLYHSFFEDDNNVDDLIEATFQEPVICFANDVPRLKHLSLIGVNLPWAHSPYLEDLDTIELALHPDKIRPSYEHWDKLLRRSPDLKKLILHYSGPRERWDEVSLNTFAWQGDDLWRPDLPSEKILLTRLEHLSLTDMDAPYLVRILDRIHLPNVKRLVLELSLEDDDSDYSEFLEKCIGAGTSISSSVRLSHDSSLHNSSMLTIPGDILPPPLPPPPAPLFPFLPHLQSLTLLALDCKISVLRSLLLCLPELRELEVDFQRTCLGDTYPEASTAWRIFSEDVSTPVPVTRTADPPEGEVVLPENNLNLLSAPNTQRHAFWTHDSQYMLPKLKVFKILRLGGRQVEEIIRYRECVVQDQEIPTSDEPPSSPSPSSSSGSDSDSYTPLPPINNPVVIIPARQKSMYVVKYTKQMVEKDTVLQRLITSGCCYFPTTNFVEHHSRRCGESSLVEERSPSAVLRRFEPELDAYGRRTSRRTKKTTQVDASSVSDVQVEKVNGWTKVMIHSEMISAEEDENEVYNFTDDDEDDSDETATSSFGEDEQSFSAE